jgi:hypothetical protein
MESMGIVFSNKYYCTSYCYFLAQQINVVIRFGGLTMSKKTAVQWLAEQLIPDAMRMFDAKTCNAIEQALQMEREQIEDAYYYDPNCDEIKDDGEQYYNETYGGQDE